VIAEMMQAVSEIPESEGIKIGISCSDWVECEKCHGTGFIEYDVDYFGRKQEWGRCNAKGCENGMVEVQSQGHSATTVQQELVGA
jgi:hypothetical protein